VFKNGAILAHPIRRDLTQELSWVNSCLRRRCEWAIRPWFT